MTPQEMKAKTKEFALKIIRSMSELPDTWIAKTLGKQLLRSGTSVGANYRAACRARSRADFIAKMGIVLEEADETAYWLELFEEAGILSQQRTAALTDEAYEFVAVAVASIKTAKDNRHSQKYSEF